MERPSIPQERIEATARRERSLQPCGLAPGLVLDDDRKRPRNVGTRIERMAPPRTISPTKPIGFLYYSGFVYEKCWCTIFQRPSTSA
jgi:hypothetical protein